MKRVIETDLPGVGVRFDIETDSGRGVGVVAHQSGRRDLVVYDELDPQRASESVVLTEDEADTLGEILGGSPLLERMADAMHRVEDLVIAWVTVDPGSALVGKTLAETGLRRRTGAGVVAIVADTGSIPVPGGDQSLDSGVTAVIVGVPAAVSAATALLSHADQ